MDFTKRLQSSLEGQEEGNRLRAVAGGVIEFRHEEGADHKQGSNQRRKTGPQAVFRTDEYLTPGWIQPPDKPVSGFDSMGPNGPDPCLTPG